jgi:septal ring factor EnvC (AmiA/AmiB activator)
MTAFGKILVFLNLVFALLTGGLIGMVYLTRTNWKASYDRINAAVQATTAFHENERKEWADKVRAKEDETQRITQQKNEREKQLTDLRAELEQVKTELAAAKRTLDKDANNVTATTTEIERRRVEVAQLNETLKNRESRIQKLEEQLTKTRDEAVNNKLLYDSLKEKFQTLMTQHEDAQRQLAMLQSRGITAPAATKVPPPEQVRGTVKAVDGNLTTISIGTDAGVNKDNLLYVYRLTPKPEYLGELTILSATPFEAVGRFKPANRLVNVKPGDEVASRITIQK